MAESPIATVAEGQLQGRLSQSPAGRSFYSFQGVPYAKPPIGSLRFRAPQPPEPWEGVRDATSEGNSSAQLDFFANRQYVGDENCLFLNVYTPNLAGESLPVMVFIHGGAFGFGSGSSSFYGGDYLIEKDVVIVTINYRCGALGFLSLNTPEVPGNAGMKDMVQALRWLKRNVKSFGGNSGNVTIFGESAGGAAVSFLTASPMSKHLISKAIIQSGTGLNSWSIQRNPLQNARDLANELGCASTDVNEILKCLSTTPVKDLVEASARLKPLTLDPESGVRFFTPVVEKEFNGVESFMTEAFICLLTSGRVADIPTMIGSNSLEFTIEMKEDLQEYIPDEFNLEKGSPESLAIAEELKRLYFVDDPKLAKYELLSDFLVNVGTHRYVQYLLNVTNKPVYYYRFGYVGELNITKYLVGSVFFRENQVSSNYAAHLDELGYLFRNDFTKHIEPTPQDVKIRERMVRLWTNFAKTGNPTPDENHFLTVTWLPATKENVYYLNIGNELSIQTSPDKKKMEFWDELYTKYFKIWDQEITNDAVAPSSEPIIVAASTIIDEKVPENSAQIQANVTSETVFVVDNPIKPDVIMTGNNIIIANGSLDKKPRQSNEIKMAQNTNVNPKDIIKANDPPKDDLPKNIGVNKFVNFYESLGGKK